MDYQRLIEFAASQSLELRLLFYAILLAILSIVVWDMFRRDRNGKSQKEAVLWLAILGWLRQRPLWIRLIASGILVMVWVGLIALVEVEVTSSRLVNCRIVDLESNSPVDQARVRLTWPSEGRETQIVTGGDGFFSFIVTGRGEIPIISISAGGFGDRTVQLAQAARETTINVALSRVYRIRFSWLVLNAATREPVSGAAVQVIRPSGRPPLSTITDDVGSFTLDLDSQESDLRIIVTADGFGPFDRRYLEFTRSSYLDPIWLTPRSSIKKEDVSAPGRKVPPKGQTRRELVGLVLDSATRLPLADATIFISLRSGHVNPPLRTGNQGVFKFEVEPDDQYAEMTVAAEGYKTEKWILSVNDVRNVGSIYLNPRNKP